jgi:hypothetical protein
MLLSLTALITQFIVQDHNENDERCGLPVLNPPRLPVPIRDCEPRYERTVSCDDSDLYLFAPF